MEFQRTMLCFDEKVVDCVTKNKVHNGISSKSQNKQDKSNRFTLPFIINTNLCETVKPGETVFIYKYLINL